MRNSENSELRNDVKELYKKGYSQKEGIKTLIEYGYTKSSAYSYWKVFAKPRKNEQGDKA